MYLQSIQSIISLLQFDWHCDPPPQATLQSTNSFVHAFSHSSALSKSGHFSLTKGATFPRLLISKANPAFSEIKSRQSIIILVVGFLPAQFDPVRIFEHMKWVSPNTTYDTVSRLFDIEQLLFNIFTVHKFSHIYTKVTKLNTSDKTRIRGRQVIIETKQSYSAWFSFTRLIKTTKL